jgi:glutathione S-transferase
VNEADKPFDFITIAMSHYCEKARWALDIKGIPYKEYPHMPLFHALVAKKYGGARTVPVLITPGAVYNDSTDILKFLDTVNDSPRLYPEKEADKKDVEQLEDLFDKKLGPAARRIAYFYLLKKKQLLLRVLKFHSRTGQYASFRFGYPLFALLMKKAMNISRAGADKSIQRIELCLTEVDERLADGRRYICGDTISAADLTFAALAAPILCPEGYYVPLPRPEELPPELGELIKKYRDRPSGQHILRLFKTDRHRKTVESQP